MDNGSGNQTDNPFPRRRRRRARRANRPLCLADATHSSRPGLTAPTPPAPGHGLQSGIWNEQAHGNSPTAPSTPTYATYELCLRYGDVMRCVTRDIIRDRAGVWDDLVDQTLVHSPPARWEFHKDRFQNLMPVVDIPAMDKRLEQGDGQSIFSFIICFLQTDYLDLGRLDHIYGEPRASFYTLLQVHRTAQSLEIPELATAALTEMTRSASRIHCEVEGTHVGRYDQNRWRITHKGRCPGGLPVIDDRSADQIGSLVRCLVEIAQAMPPKETARGASIDVPKDVGIALVAAAYVLWNQLELDDVFRNWWDTEEGRLFQGLILEHQEFGWDFGIWRH